MRGTGPIRLDFVLKSLDGLQMSGRIVGAPFPLRVQEDLQYPDFALQARDRFNISRVEFAECGSSSYPTRRPSW